MEKASKKYPSLKEVSLATLQTLPIVSHRKKYGIKILCDVAYTAAASALVL